MGCCNGKEQATVSESNQAYENEPQTRDNIRKICVCNNYAGPQVTCARCGKSYPNSEEYCPHCCKPNSTYGPLTAGTSVKIRKCSALRRSWNYEPTRSLKITIARKSMPPRHTYAFSELIWELKTYYGCGFWFSGNIIVNWSPCTILNSNEKFPIHSKKFCQIIFNIFLN